MARTGASSSARDRASDSSAIGRADDCRVRPRRHARTLSGQLLYRRLLTIALFLEHDAAVSLVLPDYWRDHMRTASAAIILVSLMAVAPIEIADAQGGGGGSGGSSGSGAGGGAASSGSASVGTDSAGRVGGVPNNAAGPGGGSTNAAPGRVSTDNPAAGLENAPTTGGVIGGTTGVPPKGVEPGSATLSETSQSDKPVKPRPCSTSARETDGTTTCIGMPAR